MPKSIIKQPKLQVIPEPALEQRTRRTYTAEYKLNIIAQADACKYGELGTLLRREKLYSNQLTAWRREPASAWTESQKILILHNIETIL